MLYNTLTNDELERRVYIEPANAEARGEMLRRVPGLIDQNDEDLEEAREERDAAESERDEALRDKESAEDAATAAETKLDEARQTIATMEARVKELTCAEGLV